VKPQKHVCRRLRERGGEKPGLRQSGNLPFGHYPLAFLLIPGVIVAAIFFVVVSFILELVGDMEKV
jgi:hypothetical protein